MLIVSLQRRIHILEGDSTGGGHGFGRAEDGKSEFPAAISDEEIITGIESIANNPTLYPRRRIPIKGKYILRGGRIKGVQVIVVVDLDGEGIITAWPEGTNRSS